jgi:hypothetical protein
MTERTFDLEASERLQADQLQSEHQQLLARYGAATMEIEAVRALLPQVKERQRALIHETATRHGVMQYQTARIEGRRLVCQLPDEPVFPPMINGQDTHPQP